MRKFALLSQDERYQYEQLAQAEEAEPMRVGREYSSGVARQTLGAPSLFRMALERDDARRRLIAKGVAIEDK